MGAILASGVDRSNFRPGKLKKGLGNLPAESQTFVMNRKKKESEARGRKVRASDMQCYCCAATQLGADRLGSSFERHEFGQSPVQPNGRARERALTKKARTKQPRHATWKRWFSTRDGQAVFVSSSSDAEKIRGRSLRPEKSVALALTLHPLSTTKSAQSRPISGCFSSPFAPLYGWTVGWDGQEVFFFFFFSLAGESWAKVRCDALDRGATASQSASQPLYVATRMLRPCTVCAAWRENLGVRLRDKQAPSNSALSFLSKGERPRCGAGAGGVSELRFAS